MVVSGRDFRINNEAARAAGLGVLAKRWVLGAIGGSANDSRLLMAGHEWDVH